MCSAIRVKFPYFSSSSLQKIEPINWAEVLKFLTYILLFPV